MDIVNYDVRSVIANAEHAAARSRNPEQAFSESLSEQILGSEGLRNRYLADADAGRGTADITGPLTSVEQSSVLNSGRFSNDLGSGPFDGDPTFKQRR
jgi:conjugal transfer mating pair stabilization protein TraG